MIPDPAVHPLLSVEDAGRECGLGRSASYAAVRRGELPTISFGRRRLVPTAALRRLLLLDEPLREESGPKAANPNAHAGLLSREAGRASTG